MGDGKSFTVAARAVFNGVVSMHRDKQSCQEVGGVSPCLFRAQMMGVCLALFFWEVAQRRLAGGGSACRGGGLSQLDRFTRPPNLDLSGHGWSQRGSNLQWAAELSLLE